VLAMIPRGRGPDVVEAFRTLRTNLLFLEGAGRPRTVALVSPNPGAGKSFCAIHLAESAVAVDAEVVLVDADLRRPVIHSRVRVPREPGLSDALRGGDMYRAIHCVEGIPNLKVMPSGSPVSDTVGVLGGRAFRGVLDALDTAELVVVDTPPGAVYADALAVSAQCDATLLVLDAKTTRRRAARLMIESLERTGATLIGVVMNNSSFSRRDTYERG
jgi:capsular exopolysaccharide synthesis family protein